MAQITGGAQRLAIIQKLFFFLALLVFVRLCFIQLVYHDFYKKYGQQQRIIRIKQTVQRGTIFDADGNGIAFSLNKPSTWLIPLDLMGAASGGKAEAIDCLKKLEEQFPAVAKYLQEHATSKFAWLERQLTPERALYLQKLFAPYALLLYEPARFCVDPIMAPVVGITSIDSVGLSGIEAFADSILTGTTVTLVCERDAHRKKFTIGYEYQEPPLMGQDLQLTVKSSLQHTVYTELAKTVKKFSAKGGAAVVLDPDSGAVLALADYPPTVTGAVLSTGCCFELGSVFKIFSALAALDEGVVSPHEIISCDGKVSYFKGVRLENWRPLYDLSFEEVVQHSSNVGLAKVVDRLGHRLYDHYRRLGFGGQTGIELPGERSGFVNEPKRWSRSSPYVLSFGYEVMATLIQLARAFSVIANGGYVCTPTLLLSNIQAKNLQKQRLYSEQTIAVIQKIAQRIGKKYPVFDCRVMGKTGTARCVENGQYSTTRHRYTFVGAVEWGGYKRVIVTFIQEPDRQGLWASQVAAPLFQKIAQRIVLQEGIVAQSCWEQKACSK